MLFRPVLLAVLLGACSLALPGTGLADDSIPLPEERIAEPSPRAELGYGWQREFQYGWAVPRADATLRAYDNENEGAVVTIFDPGASLTAPAEVSDAFPAAADVPIRGNLTGVRARLDGQLRWRAGVAAVDGYAWSVEEGEDGRLRVVARDDREAIVRRATVPRSNFAEAVSLHSTTRGVRAVLAQPAHDAPEGRGGRVVDARGRTVADLPAIAPKAAVALADDTLLILGDTSYGRSLARLSPSGRVTYPRIVRPKATQVRQLLETASGLRVLLVDTSGETNVYSFAQLSRNGVLSKIRKLDDSDIAWPSGCQATSVRRWLDVVRIGPSGTPLVEFDCHDRASGSSTTALIELDERLGFRRVVATGRNSGPGGGGILPDGRLFVVREDTTVGAITLPSALPVTRGRLGSVSARGTEGATVRVSCRQPDGAICSGRIEIRGPAGDLFGWAPYALPGRPGPGRAVAEVTVHRSSAAANAFAAGLPAGATTALFPLSARFERGSAAPPTP